MGAHVIDDSSWLDHAGPLNETRYPEAAFPVRRLLASERRRAAVRPSHDFGAIVSRVDDDGVVSDSKAVDQF